MSHINSNLHGLWVLKITYLDVSFNWGTCIFVDGSCKSKEYSSFEVTSKHENEKQKLLSISSKHLNIPFKSYDRKKSDLFVYHPVSIFQVSYQLYLFAAGKTYIPKFNYVVFEIFYNSKEKHLKSRVSGSLFIRFSSKWLLAVPETSISTLRRFATIKDNHRVSQSY